MLVINVLSDLPTSLTSSLDHLIDHVQCWQDDGIDVIDPIVIHQVLL